MYLETHHQAQLTTLWFSALQQGIGADPALNLVFSLGCALSAIENAIVVAKPVILVFG